jgi:hypothetical protein
VLDGNMDLTFGQNHSQSAIARPDMSSPSVARRCVRLDSELAKVLTQHCKATGETSSAVMRSALRRELTRSTPTNSVVNEPSKPVSEAPQSCTETQGKTVSASQVPMKGTTYAAAEFPGELAPIRRALASLGAASWAERKSRFLGVIALSQICSELSAEPRDNAILLDFLALAEKYGMLQ